ncbi:HOG (high osmolarity glycerol) pathway protein [Podila horticola]|nr:HOG (high osmolarity glycerol) pathway protein [Podila horticola]
MAPVSLPLYLGSGNETTNPVDLKARKRVSVHIPQDAQETVTDLQQCSMPVSVRVMGTLLPSFNKFDWLHSSLAVVHLVLLTHDTSTFPALLSSVIALPDNTLIPNVKRRCFNHGRDFSRAGTGTGAVVRVRDFAYPKTHPYHLGHFPPPPACEESDVEEDDESMGWYTEKREEDHSHFFQDEEEPLDRTHGQARGLYDFDAETDTELSFREGEYLWIHSRQFPGWFLGEIAGVTGLVPENYVQIL